MEIIILKELNAYKNSINKGQRREINMSPAYSIGER